MSYKIKKVLNSSVVLSVNDSGAETIVLGKGIGYGKKRGEIVPNEDINQLFVPLENEQQNQVLELLQEITPEIVNITTEIISYAKSKLNTELSQHLSFTLMDHIDFAIQRYKEDMNIQNKLYWEVQNYYPDEFAVSEVAVNLINERFDIELPKAEIANISFHIINAEKEDIDEYDSLKVTELVDDVINLIRYQLKNKLKTSSISYQRLITHVKYFADRLLSNKQLSDPDDTLIMHLQKKYPEANKMANQVCVFIQRKYNIQVSDEEFSFLVVHIERNIH